MKIVNVVFPVVVDDFSNYRATVDYYRRVLGLPLRAEFQHAGASITSLGPLVVVGSADPSSLRVPRQVDAIFIADDLQDAWRHVQADSEILVAPENTPSGGRFVVRHVQGDGRVIEYLDLRNVQRGPGR